MLQVSVESILNSSKQDFLKLLDSKIFMTTTREVHFYAPSFAFYKNNHFSSATRKAFPTISITGANCVLNCKHCGGNLLTFMHSAVTPTDLFEVCSKLKQDGALGCLISGGCMPDGTVPFKSFVSTMVQVKHKLGLTVFVHTGLIDLETAMLLKQSAAVDAVLIDVIGSQETIHDIYRLNVSVSNYAKSLEALQKSDLPFVPHVLVGLNGDALDGEYAALQMISKTTPAAIVIIAFTPLPKTEMAKTKPPQPHNIARIIATARTMFPKTPIVLGCMRPKNRQHIDVDVLALKAGANAIAFPTTAAINFAKTQDWPTTFSPYCCTKILTDLNFNKKQLT
jgi:uncharacterized radical SAM superfamily protein